MSSIFWHFIILTLSPSLLLVFGLDGGLLAQDKHTLAQSKVPLEHLLNGDGALDLKRGFHGSLDPTGWQMVTGTDGEPRFVPANAAQQTAGAAQLVAVPGDENWDDRFGTPGPDAHVHAIAVSGNEVYAGGSFTTAGGVSVNRIAKWDGRDENGAAVSSRIYFYRLLAVQADGESALSQARRMLLVT